MGFGLWVHLLGQQSHSDRAVIWLITDGKPGHLNQLRGLGRRLTHYTGYECIEVPVPNAGGWRWLLGTNPCPGYPAPVMAIAAGSRTQTCLLAAKRHFGCPAVVLMRPNLPYRWFDAAIVPAHDQPPGMSHVLATLGVINDIEPQPPGERLEHMLLLIGGHSHHYGWDSDALVQQIGLLISEHPSVNFVLSDSRRTPPDFLTALAPIAGARLQLLSHTQTPPGWLARAMADADAIWVTPDSVSMVYEAITSGRPTGIFDLPEKGAGRVTRGIAALCEHGRLRRFDQRHLPTDGTELLWEADRAARWLVSRFFPDQ